MTELTNEDKKVLKYLVDSSAVALVVGGTRYPLALLRQRPAKVLNNKESDLYQTLLSKANFKDSYGSLSAEELLKGGSAKVAKVEPKK